MDIKSFLRQIENDCRLAGVEFIVSPRDRVHYGHIVCNGFFESAYPIELTSAHILGEITDNINESGLTKPILAVACGNKTDTEFLSLVIHEYCHMKQFVGRSSLWIAADEFSKFDGWLDGSEITQIELDTVWKKIILLEADCEHRVISLIETHNLSLDIEEYSRRANSYLFFYHWVKKNRKWYNKAPYEIQSILDAMPASLFSDITEYTKEDSINKKIMSLFEQCI